MGKNPVLNIHPLPTSMTPSDGSSTLLAGYISLKELDENASKVLLGFRRWAIAECLFGVLKEVDGGKAGMGGGVYRN